MGAVWPAGCACSSGQRWARTSSWVVSLGAGPAAIRAPSGCSGGRRGDGRRSGDGRHRRRGLAGHGRRQPTATMSSRRGMTRNCPACDVVGVGDLVGVHQRLHRDRVGRGDQRQRVAALAPRSTAAASSPRDGRRRRRRRGDRRERRPALRVVIVGARGHSDDCDGRDDGQRRPVRDRMSRNRRH